MRRNEKEYFEKFLEKFKEGYYSYKDGKILRHFKKKNQFTELKLEEPEICCKKNNNGYMRIHFNGKYCYSHRIIYAMHHGVDKLLEKECIDHINGIKTDNRIENLRQLSIKENTLEAERLGNYKRTYGEINGMCKIKEKELKEIFDLRNYGFTQQMIADMYGVKQSTICNILNKKIRKNG